MEALQSSLFGPETTLGIYLASFVVCILSGFIPLINTEAYLLAVAALAPPAHIIPLTLTASLGQMIAKVVLYYGGKGALRVPSSERWKGRIERARERIMSWPGGINVALFVSASVGIPPLYAVSILAGTLRVPLLHFCVIGFVGRFVRFAGVCAVPLLIRSAAS